MFIQTGEGNSRSKSKKNLEKQNIGKQKHADKIHSTPHNKQIMSKRHSRHKYEDVWNEEAPHCLFSAPGNAANYAFIASEVSS